MSRVLTLWCCFGALVCCLKPAPAAAVENPSGIGSAAVESHMDHFKTAPGVAVSLFASEPMVRNPTDIDVDARGRVWVAEGVNYRSSFKPWGTLESAGDRILILEDTNHDGFADKETVFYQDPSVNSALGVCVLGNKVIVSDSPNVFVLTDTNNDGVADTRELMFTGIGGYDHDHGVHAFSFGPDGKVCFNMGNESKHLFYPLQKAVPLHGLIGKVAMRPVVDLEGNAVNDEGKPYRMGMVFRCNPDGSDVETLAWNFRNSYEVAVDSFGTVWQSDNDDDGNRGVRINYVMEHGNYGYCDELTGASWQDAWGPAWARGAPEDQKVFYEWHQFDPGVVPDVLHTGAGAPSGIAVYEGSLLPKPFQNQLVHCDAGPRVVRSYPTRNNGAGYQAQILNLLTSDDTWFRPCDICAGPDGSLFVADWNDGTIGAHNMVDVKLPDMTGRIYRLAPPGETPRVPRVDLSTTEGCIAALCSPNGATRYLGWTKLHELQSGAEKQLRKLWSNPDARLRARALQLLARIPGRATRYLNAAAKDADPNVRIAALRIAVELNTDVIPLVAKLHKDRSPQVRRQCALALRHNHAPEAVNLWAALALQYQGNDRWYLEALGIGADEQWDKFFAAWRMRVGNPLGSAAAREIVWRSRSHETPALLAKYILEPETPPAERRRFLRSLDFAPLPERNQALLQLLASEKKSSSGEDEIALAALGKVKVYGLEESADTKNAVVHMLNDVRGKPAFVELVREFKLKGQERGLIEVAGKNPFDGANVEAVRLLLYSKETNMVRQALAGPSGVTIARAMGSAGSRRILPFLLPVITNAAAPISLRKAAVQSITQLHSGSDDLLAITRDGALPADLKLSAAAELSHSRWDAVREQSAALLPMPKTRDAATLPPIAELAARKGDIAHGAQVFRSETATCSKCHQINGEGVDFGPNLSEIG
ncbi:MAG TPA: PVC-type heme-binding CxxCH protein, partial [Verrucomicrobiae bacterium]|nr:PVC-type heme-binding CxxCH protein [Verrucomicrobiae bacterium]